jgi:hypothetical protein
MKQAIPPGRSFLRRIFVSTQGIRAGWSLALFLALYSALTLAIQFSFASIPALRDWAASQPRGVITAIGQIEFTGLELLILFGCAGLVSRIEGRSFRDYGFPRAKSTGGALSLGLALGFSLASLLMGLMAMFGGYSVHGLAGRGSEILPNALLYGIGFLMVAVFEEFTFRGFLQATLQRGIGFWPAALILSIGFGAVHLPNLGKAWIASLLAVEFGCVAALSLKRTGALWFIIGLHAAFDWGAAFFYSAPIASLTARGHLLNASLQGPDWLTGGQAGPVGSAFAFVVIALAGAIIHFMFPPSGPAFAPEKQPIDNRMLV